MIAEPPDDPRVDELWRLSKAAGTCSRFAALLLVLDKFELEPEELPLLGAERTSLVRAAESSATTGRRAAATLFQRFPGKDKIAFDDLCAWLSETAWPGARRGRHLGFVDAESDGGQVVPGSERQPLKQAKNRERALLLAIALLANNPAKFTNKEGLVVVRRLGAAVRDAWSRANWAALGLDRPRHHPAAIAPDSVGEAPELKALEPWLAPVRRLLPSGYGGEDE